MVSLTVKVGLAISANLDNPSEHAQNLLVLRMILYPVKLTTNVTVRKLGKMLWYPDLYYINSAGLKDHLPMRDKGEDSVMVDSLSVDMAIEWLMLFIEVK